MQGTFRVFVASSIAVLAWDCLLSLSVKSYIRTLAELGYNALSLRMATILGGVVGASERNLQELFEMARRRAPTLLFIDEIDAVGTKR